MRARQSNKGNKIKADTPAAESAAMVRNLRKLMTNDIPVAGDAKALASADLHIPAQGTERVWWPGLQENVETRLAEVALQEYDISRGERCLRELGKLVASELGPSWEARAFGSFANGFGTSFSDLDVTCWIPGADLGPDVQRQAQQIISLKLLPHLRQHAAFSIRDEVLGARVPVVKMCFEGHLDVDVSCHNPMPLLNTRLLRAYARVDTRIRDLGVAVKIWAKGASVCDASRSHLSSYAFALMVVYFLQVHPEVHLPALPVDAFDKHGAGKHDARVAAASMRCDLDLAGLLVRFFDFYANHFCWGTEVVSVRCGSRRAASQPLFASLRGRHHQGRLHVEDPYQLERNLHCVLGEEEEQVLRGALALAARQVAQGETPLALTPTAWILKDSGAPGGAAPWPRPRSLLAGAAGAAPSARQEGGGGHAARVGARDQAHGMARSEGARMWPIAEQGLEHQGDQDVLSAKRAPFDAAPAAVVVRRWPRYQEKPSIDLPWGCGYADSSAASTRSPEHSDNETGLESGGDVEATPSSPAGKLREATSRFPAPHLGPGPGPGTSPGQGRGAPAARPAAPAGQKHPRNPAPEPPSWQTAHVGGMMFLRF